MFNSIEINSDSQYKLLNIEESQYCDVKSEMIDPSKLSQTISAFANASGGDIYVGINENTHTKERYFGGFISIEETNKYIQVMESLEGLNANYDITYLHIKNNHYLMQITVFKTNSIVKSSDSTIYIRKGAQNIKINDPDKIKRLEIDKGIFPYENETVPESDIQDAIGSKIYDIFYHAVIPNIEKYTWLRTQKLCIDSNLNIAGVMLFTDEPQIVLPKRSAIKIFRYKTTKTGSRDTLDGNPITIEGSAYDQIYASVQKVKSIIESIKTFDTTFSDISYPETTIHEIITNAVLHRDYSIAKDIQVRIYDNRVEVESPGKLAGHITLKNILFEQFARNPKIVRLINKFPNPPNKDVGEGLNTAFKAMKELRLKQPEIIETETSVIVIIKHEKLSSPEETIMNYMKSHSEITNKIGREITGIESENVMKRVFWKLRDAQMLEMIPNRKGSKSAWQLVQGANVDEYIEREQLEYEQLSLFEE